ncbi:MAG: hypothetical protein JWP59_4451 [Massilia sp.]|jgi:hypothetical protein|nr:hypothetical protein [Massilia sp.]
MTAPKHMGRMMPARGWLRRRWPECLLVLGLAAALAPLWPLLGLAQIDPAALPALCRSVLGR